VFENVAATEFDKFTRALERLHRMVRNLPPAEFPSTHAHRKTEKEAAPPPGFLEGLADGD